MGQEIEKDAPSWLRPRDSRDRKELLESCLRRPCWLNICFLRKQKYKHGQWRTTFSEWRTLLLTWSFKNFKSSWILLEIYDERIDKTPNCQDITKVSFLCIRKAKKFQAQLRKLTDQKVKIQCLTKYCFQKVPIIPNASKVQLVELWMWYKDMVKAWQVVS